MVQVDDAFYQAVTAFQNGEIERAEDLCAEILENHPHHGNTLNLMGVIFLKQRAFKKACELIQMAMQCHPQRAPIFSYNLAFTYSLMGNIIAAVKVYENAANVFRERGEKEETLNCLEKAALLLRDHRHLNEAKYFYIRIIEIDPSNISAHNDLGVIFQKEGHLADAIDCFTRVIQLNPTYATAYNNLGLIFLLQKKFKEAIVVLEKSLEIDPLCIEAHINLGNLYLEHEKLEKSTYHCKLALEIDPLHPGVHNNLGIILHRQGKIEEAILAYKKALEIDPNYVNAKKHLDIANQDLEKSNLLR